ncbi:phosphatase PAP2 family protein [Cryptosporangium japonicum]|uniref:Phosphatidic acid phosphatase type 2/haloperoxidase domain-containing protein n=1 Tax=Cryptosporangium japonicum TaxID=80872 RepID=A0ABN0VBP1_9ACTN
MSRSRTTILVAGLAFVAVTIGLAADVLTGPDRSIAAAIARNRIDALYWPARVGFSLGQNWVFPAASALVAVACSVRRRSARPVVGLVGVWLFHTLVVGATKLWAGRPPPATGDPHLHAVAAELSLRMSYPSGHAANVVVFSATLGVLLAAYTGDPRWTRRMLAVGAASAAVCVTAMVYLGFHWTTDAAAGLLLGIAIRGLAVPFCERMSSTPVRG